MTFAIFLNTLCFLQSADSPKQGYFSLDETSTSQVILDLNPCFSSAADGSDTIFVDYILRNLLIIMGELGDSTLKTQLLQEFFINNHLLVLILIQLNQIY